MRESTDLTYDILKKILQFQKNNKVKNFCKQKYNNKKANENNVKLVNKNQIQSFINLIQIQTVIIKKSRYMSSFQQNHLYQHYLFTNNNPKGKHKDTHSTSNHPNTNNVHNIKLNQNVTKKKDGNKNVGYQTKKRPQTPDPVSSYAFGQDPANLPQPQIILKQIQKNVNVLKQMYFASLSQHSSITHRQNNKKIDQQASLSQSQQNNNRSNVQQKLIRNVRKSVDLINMNKKSVPQISLMPNYQQQIIGQNKNSKNKGFQDFVKAYTKDKSKQKNKKDQMKKNYCKQFPQEKVQKLTERRKSSVNLHKSGNNIKPIKNITQQQKKIKKLKQKQIKQYQMEQKQALENQQNNIHSLFQIFKFYKRSIDSSLSKNPNSKTTTEKTKSNCPNTHFSNNHSTIQQKSHKDTPNNSTTKHTTHNKNTTVSRLHGSSIQPSIQVSVEEDPFRNSKSPQFNKNSRNNSNSSSKNKNKNLQKTKKSVSNLSKKDQNKNNIYEVNRRKGSISKQQQKVSKKKSNEKTQKNVQKIKQKSQNKVFKKKPILKQTELIANPNNIISNLNNIKSSICQQNRKNNRQLCDPIDQLDFPQIQSSAFNRNMPILEQDSRQEASSSLIITSGQNQMQLISSRKRNNKFDGNNSSGQIYLNCEQKQNDFHKFMPNSKNEMQIFEQNNKRFIGKVQQFTRLPTPSFVTSDADQKMQKYSKEAIKSLQNQGTTKSKLYAGQEISNNSQEDSLVGCEIPKRESASFDLDNFELVSFEL